MDYGIDAQCAVIVRAINFCGGDFARHPRNTLTIQWRLNGRDGVSNHQPHDCLLNRLFRRWSKKTSKFRVTGLCTGNSPVTGEFPAQMASNAENVSISWHIQDPIQDSSPVCVDVKLS